MKLLTFDRKGTPTLGVLVGDKVMCTVSAGSPITTMKALVEAGPSALAALKDLVGTAKPESYAPLASVKILAPFGRPTKNIFCVGRNYKLHIEEGARARGVAPTFPPVPEYFSKPPTTVIGHEQDVEYSPKVSDQMDYEVELAMVIGKTCKNLEPSEAMSAVFGYTIVNDVSARDLQRSHGQWFKGKGLDTTCPIGPVVVTADEFGDPSGKRLTLRVNGEIRQDSNTSDLLFDCSIMVSSLSMGITLEPCDIIATGTPSGVALGMTPQAWLQDGDVMECEVEGIGILRNKMRKI
jgi:2-keto-4-pentenoate hydratase/2-oxohepta-3-ene-1,7-dioic acid hydratase in catechol pathway